METKNYYNAKPSKISNIGKDVAGAKRMNFDTYETVEEREIKERKKALDKGIKVYRDQIKAEVLSESPSVANIINLMSLEFELTYGLLPTATDARAIISAKRYEINSPEARTEYNKLVNSFNKFRTTVRRLEYNPSYYLKRMAWKYAPRGSFTEQSGQSFDWKDFKLTSDLKDSIEYLSISTSAVQFGNTVTDNERAYISFELAEFIKHWMKTPALRSIDLTPLHWSFGARGKSGSVAFYQPSSKVISVNRNNIGSVIHEVGHFIDDVSKNISSNISYETIKTYRDSLPAMDDKSRRYYCKREEIFARAFEAYCFKHLFGFSAFAQVGKAFLPELNEELIGLIEKALNLNKEA